MHSTAPLPTIRTGVAAGLSLGVGVLVDRASDGPAGVGVLIAVVLAAISLSWIARPRPAGSVFLLAGVALSSFALVRASPVLLAIDLLSTFGLLGLAASFARGGAPFRSGARSYAIGAVAWIGQAVPAAAIILRSLVGASGRSRRLPRAALITLPVALIFALLLGSADAVFARLLRSPFENIQLADLPRHASVAIVAALTFGALTLRSLLSSPATRLETPVPGGGLRPVEWTALLATIDCLFALFVAVQLVTLFGGRERVVHQAGLTFAEYARSGFWQLLAAAALTGIVVAGTWIGGRPAAGREQRRFLLLTGGLVALSLVVLSSGFQRLVLYEDAFGFTWPRLLGHAATMLTGSLLVSGACAVALRRSAWLPGAAVALGVLTVIALNGLDPEAFIAERNLARVRAGHALDVAELRSLSADAVPAIAASLPTLGRSDRSELERHLAIVGCELREESGRLVSFNLARARAERILDELALQSPSGC